MQNLKAALTDTSVLKKLKKALGLGDDLASLPSELLSDAVYLIY
jgi:hypothetical protein